MYARICCLMVCVGCLRICRHRVLILTLAFLTLLQKSLQQDPSHDGSGVEERRQGSDVVEDVQERAERDSASSEEEVSARPLITRASPRKRPSDEGRTTPSTPSPNDREEASGGAEVDYSQSDDMPLLEMCCYQPCNRERNEEKLICANEECMDKSTKKPREVHMSSFLASTIVKEYSIKTPNKRGRGTRMPFIDTYAMCPKCTKSAVKTWVRGKDGQQYVSDNKTRLANANVLFK